MSRNEFGQLDGGRTGRVKVTDTIFFHNPHEVPHNRKSYATYRSFQFNLRPEKKESNQTFLTVGGNRINYNGKVGTPISELLLIKIMLNSVISATYAKFVTIDISNFYLNTPMKRYEYIRIKSSNIQPKS